MKFMKISFLMVGILLLMSVGSVISAQNQDVAVTITAPPWMGYFLDDDAFLDGFEEQHPGVRVVYIEPMEDVFSGEGVVADPVGYLDRMERYVSTADVVFMDQYFMSPEVVTAGYLLNLEPLAQTDPNLNISDFYGAAWQAFQWEGGLWALPVNASPRFFVYRPDVFDAAGLRHPGPEWTVDDFASAMRSLTEFDAAGTVTRPAYMGWVDTSLLRSFLSQGFYDFGTQPNAPALNTPELNEVLNTLAALDKEGLLNSFDYQGDYMQIPLRLEGPWALSDDYIFSGVGPDGATPEPITLEPALLPGGVSGIYTSGFAVSSGTNNPELAYELVKYVMMNSGEQFGGESALRSLRAQFSEQYGPPIPADAQPFLEQSLENGISIGELRYSQYLDVALQQIFNEDVPVGQALEEAQAKAMSAYEMALERAETRVIQVQPAPPPVQLAAGEIELTLGIQQPVSSLPNREMWEQVVTDFVAEDPTVGHVDLDSNFYGAEGIEADCYIQDYNNISTTDLNTLINLDPFLDADPDFNPSDMIGGAMSLVQRDGRTWALPLYMRPTMLQYDRQRLQDAGALLPDNGGWTSDTFTDVLRTMELFMEEDEPVFFMGGANFEWYMLMAAYGGSPYDYSTNPPTLRYTDPAVISAIEQVLGLARDGLIAYFPLTQEFSASFQGFGGGGGGGDSRGPAIFMTRLYPYLFEQPPDAQGEVALTPFVRGSQVTPFSYDIGAAYISSTSQNPEACYRLIRRIADTIGLTDGMPVRQSQIDNPALVAAAGAEVVQLYQEIAATLQSANAQYFGYTDTGPASFTETVWLNRIFDEVVLGENPVTNLPERLADAEQKVQSFRACVAELPPFDPNIQEEAYYKDYFGMIDNCGLSVDPDWVSPFGFQ